jgi:hypothetical protein
VRFPSEASGVPSIADVKKGASSPVDVVLPFLSPERIFCYGSKTFF